MIIKNSLPERTEQELKTEDIRLWIFMNHIKEIEFIRKGFLTALFSWLLFHFATCIIGIISLQSNSYKSYNLLDYYSYTVVEMIMVPTVLFSVFFVVWKIINVSKDTELKIYESISTDQQTYIVTFGEKIYYEIINKKKEIEYQKIKRIFYFRNFLFIYDENDVAMLKISNKKEAEQMKEILMHKIIKDYIEKNPGATIKSQKKFIHKTYKSICRHKPLMCVIIFIILSYLPSIILAVSLSVICFYAYFVVFCGTLVASSIIDIASMKKIKRETYNGGVK